MRSLNATVLFSVLCAAFLGLGAVVLPVWFLSLRIYSAPLFPYLRSGIEGLSFLTIIFLFVSGLGLGSLGTGHPFLLGIATVGLLPLLAIAEMVISPTSHNMWPLEFIFYGFISLSAVLGAFIGRFVYKNLRNRDAQLSDK